MNFSSLVRIGIRNTFRNKRRTILNMIAIVFGIITIIYMTAIARGFYAETYDRVIELEAGHIKIHKKTYLEKENKMPLEENIQNYKQIIAKVNKLDEVVQATPRTKFPGILSNTQEKKNIIGISFVPESEKQVSILDESIVKGKYPANGENGILIGDRLANLLDVEVGDNLKLYGRSVYDSNELLILPVLGFFKYGFHEMDSNFVYVTKDSAESLLLMEDTTTEIVIRATGREAIDKLIPAIKSEINDSDLSVESWRYFNQSLIEGTKADIGSLYVIIGIIVILTFFGIVNSMSMNIFERKREIGAMRAMGLSKNETLTLFLIESFYLGFISIVIGMIIGGLLVLVNSYYGIPMPKEVFESGTFAIPFAQEMYAVGAFSDYVLAFVIGFFASIIGGAIPAMKVRKMKIVETLHNQ